MNHYIGLIGATLCLLLALATISIVGPRLGLRLISGRYASIDGLRGYAAFFVFLSHAAAWFYYARSGQWAVTPIRAYGNLGSIGVVVFFMITAYLFITKLAGATGRSMDWLRLFTSRVTRLAPLYLFAMAMLLLVTAAATGFELRDGVATQIGPLAKWLAFTIGGAPDLNQLKDTWLIIAGVTWSLPYEIFFYLMLPLIALLIRRPASMALVVVTTSMAGLVLWAQPDIGLVAPFLGGAIAAWAARAPSLQRWAGSSAASALTVTALVLVFARFWGATRPLPLALVTLAFCCIACGNSIFGALTTRAARLLGEVSYSMYLLHAIALYAVVRWGIGLDRLAVMSPVTYWLLMAALTPPLVVLCTLTFVLIERPGIDSTEGVVACLRRVRGTARQLYQR